MASLRLLNDPSKSFVLEGEFTIGRTSENSLMLPDDSEVSRQHARVTRAGAAYTLADLGSTNGTFIERDGRRWQVAPDIALRDGDVIHIGASRLAFAAGDDTLIGGMAAPETIVGRVIPPLRSPDSGNG